MPQFTVKATALVPATTEFNIEAESSSAACAHVRDYLENLSFGASWKVGDTEVELIPDDDIQITDVESLTKDADVAAGDSSRMFCATFELVSVQPADDKQIDLDDMDRCVQTLLRSLQQDPASPIIDWHYNDRGPSTGQWGEARAQISVFGRGPTSAETGADLRDALVSKTYASHGSLVASAFGLGVREATPMEGQRARLFLDSKETAPATPRLRRPRA